MADVCFTLSHNGRQLMRGGEGGSCKRMLCSGEEVSVCPNAVQRKLWLCTTTWLCLFPSSREGEIRTYNVHT